MAKRRIKPKYRVAPGVKPSKTKGGEILVPLTNGWYYRVKAAGKSWQMRHLYDRANGGYNLIAYRDAGYYLFRTQLEPERAAVHVVKYIEEMDAKTSGRPLPFSEALRDVTQVGVRRSRRNAK